MNLGCKTNQAKCEMLVGFLVVPFPIQAGGQVAVIGIVPPFEVEKQPGLKIECAKMKIEFMNPEMPDLTF
jgi:hypothetical protein